MRRLLFAALLIPAACGPRAPEGSLAVALDAGDHGFVLDAQGGRVLFTRGSYPRKTYAGAIDLSSGKIRLHRSPGRFVSDPSAPRLTAPRALWRAGAVVDEYAGERPRGDLVLDAVPGDASSDQFLALGDGRVVLCLGEPAWGKGSLVISATAERKRATAGWWRGGSELDKAVPVSDGAAACALADSSPRLGLLIDDEKAPRFAVWDLRIGRQVSSAKLPSAPAAVGAGEGRIFASLKLDDGGTALAALDARTGRVADVFASTVPVASAAEAPDAVFVLTRDDKAASVESHVLAPQTLIKLDAAGKPAWTAAWSRLPSSLVGWDPASRRLVIAVEDQAYTGLWAVPAEPAAVSAAAAQVERASGMLRRRIGSAFGALALGAMVLAIVFGLLNAA